MKSSAPILFVEDNRDDRELTIRTLTAQGIRNPIIVAHDGEEALDFVAARGAFENRASQERPCLVLLDLKLPKVSGVEVLRAIRSDPELKAVPVVIFTSSREPRDLRLGYTEGANSYVQKPISVAGFDQALRTMGVYWVLMNEHPPRESEA